VNPDGRHVKDQDDSDAAPENCEAEDKILMPFINGQVDEAQPTLITYPCCHCDEVCDEVFETSFSLTQVCVCDCVTILVKSKNQTTSLKDT